MGLGINQRLLYGRVLAVAIFGISLVTSAATVVTPKGEAALTFGTTAVPVVAYRSVGLLLDGATAPAELFLTGGGNRDHVFGINLYGVGSYTSVDPASVSAGLKESELLDTVLKAETKLLQLTMLTNLTASQIRNAFIDALAANSVDIKSPPIAGLLEKINFPFKTKLEVNIIGYAKDSHTEVLRVEVAGQEPLVAEGENLASDFWKIWFGEPVDAKMGVLRANLIKGLKK